MEDKSTIEPKRPYEKPLLQSWSLHAEEVLTAGCKLGTGGPPPFGAGCSLGGCNAAGS